MTYTKKTWNSLKKIKLFSEIQRNGKIILKLTTNVRRKYQSFSYISYKFHYINK